MSPQPAGDKPAYNKLEDSQLGWPHIVVQWLVIKLTRLWLAVCYHHRVHGLENKPKGFQSYIVASNHVSMKDPLIVAASLDFQPIAYMAKIELFKHPLAIAFFRATAAFAVNREKLELATVKSALKVLKHGKWALGLFPEGTRKKEPSATGEAKRGVAYFAQAAKVPVLPVGFVIKGRHIAVCVGQLIPPEGDLDDLTARIAQAIADLSTEAETLAAASPTPRD